MIYTQVIENNRFIGRKFERGFLKKISHLDHPSVVIIYGRRRIGKTELIEQTYRTRNILKFEGLEGQSEAVQRAHVILQLSEYTQDNLLKNVHCDSWTEVFQTIARYLENNKPITLYFEEIQWLANYQDIFIAELKYVWDNLLRHHKDLIIVLCGSSPSFMLTHVVKSRALYNRAQYEIPLQAFTLHESRAFLKNRSNREVLDAYLSVGGIPVYLKRLDEESSVFLSLCYHSFTSGGFFLREYEKIFISNLAGNKHYKKIVEFLSKKRFASRNEIAKILKIKTGGTLTALLQDLELCGFIKRYVPFNLETDSLLARYCIQDSYLQFYFKFIHPIRLAIERGDYNHQPTNAIKADNYHKWLGFAFERFCRNNHTVIAKLLGFSAVAYRVGTYFSKRTTTEDPSYQIDLIFDRADGVYTICEIKYVQEKITSKVITEFERKLSLFVDKNKTIQKVLIASNGCDPALIARHYFDQILTLEDIFSDS